MSLIAALSPLLLAAGAVPEPCNPIAGWEQVLADDEVRWIVLGEMHGTNEVPAAFADAVCLTARARPVVVAVEQPSSEQPAIDAFLASDGGEEAKRAFLAAPMWNFPMKDGRSSEAAFRLFETLRQMKAAGRIEAVAAFQPSRFDAQPTSAEIEKAMADLVLASARPGATVLVLTGNTHARRTEVPWEPRYLPMAGHLPRDSTVTINSVTAGGEAWTCSGPDTCGPNLLRGASGGHSRGLSLGLTEGGAYSGVLHLGVPATASAPQVPAVPAQQASGPAKAAPSAAPSLSDVRERLREGKVMPALALLERVVEADPASAGSAAQYWAFSGDIATADALFARSMSARSGQPATAREIDLSDARPEPAIEAIVRAAKGQRVVMINEAHHAPRHRAFTHLLMLALREEGFTHFAAETFCSGCPDVLENGVPVVRTGPYILDPVFADLARQAGAVGYELLGYEIRREQSGPPGEGPLESLARREQAQAENLAAALAADPAMRVLVHVGFGHLNEASGSTAMFAARLKQLTGEDPLTIDQNEGTRQASAEYDSALYKAFVDAFGEPAAPVAIGNDPQQPLGSYTVDLSVIHPTQRDVAGRPDWLAMGGYRKPREVRLAPLGERSLMRAFVAGEPEGAIAMDQILVRAGAPEVTLMLPAGEYRLTRQTEGGEDLPLAAVRIP